jgi:porphobilinogen deaminase
VFGESEDFKFHILGLRLLIGDLAFFSDAVRQALVRQGINKTTHSLKEVKNETTQN